MGKTLVIAEKPSVGKDYAKALPGTFKAESDYLESDRFVVSWAVGHLVELAEPEDYDPKYKLWSLNRLPIIPDEFHLKPIEGRGKKQLDVLRKLAKRKDVDEVVNGCDAGREGELIFEYIRELLAVDKPVKRLWVSSMTKDAIRDGFEHLRDSSEMAPLSAAARSRGEADWLVGMNGTRAATKVGRLEGVVSLGRVQTPTLALIVRRDLEIDAFVPETYFQVDARFQLDQEHTYLGRWFEGKQDRTSEHERAQAVADAAAGADATVLSVKRNERKSRPPLLSARTSLQREANSRYGLSAQRTLAAAQRLYEGSAHGALLTYPRTRSQFLPADQIPTLKATARSLTAIPAVRAAAEYVAGLDVLPLARVVNDAKVDDHHAIVPTGELPRKELTGDDARVFDLVVRRFLAVFHPDAKFEDTEIVTEAGGHRFRTRGRRLIEAGWRTAAFGEEAAAEEPPAGDDDEPRQTLPKVEEGEQGTCESAEVLEKQTKPPPRYSEASLLKDMETAGKQIEDEELREAMKEAGLGTPATRAETIEKLIRVGYIERLGKQLRATSKGRQAIALLGDHALTSADLTGRWEKRLSDIERGAGRRGEFMDDIREFTSQIVEYFRELSSEDVRALRAEIGPCPNCDGIIRENSRAYGCSPWKSREVPGCGFVIWKQQKGRSISAAEARELLQKGQTELLDGFKTRPSRARLVLAEGNQGQLIADDGTRLDAPAGPREKIADCPKCDGEIRENSRAYGCSSWKSKKETGCGFVIWKSTKGRQISIDEARQVIENGASDWMDFKDRKGPFRGRLVLTPDQTVEVQREDEGTEAATQAA